VIPIEETRKMATKLKYLLIPLLLIQGSYSVQAQGFFQDLFTVEGIQFRYGGIRGTQNITIDNASLTSESKAADGYQTIQSVNAGLYLPVIGPVQTVRLPYTFVFKEKLMNSWSFRGPYFDFASGSILDIPVKDTSATDQRNLTEEIDNATKNQVTTIKWFDRSADLHRTVLMVGYRWGVFYPSVLPRLKFRIALYQGLREHEGNQGVLPCRKSTLSASRMRSGKACGASSRS
jgi:hypothetical protein